MIQRIRTILTVVAVCGAVAGSTTAATAATVAVPTAQIQASSIDIAIPASWDWE